MSDPGIRHRSIILHLRHYNLSGMVVEKKYDNVRDSMAKDKKTPVYIAWFDPNR